LILWIDGIADFLYCSDLNYLVLEMDLYISNTTPTKN
jgi:hypothetical protein